MNILGKDIDLGGNIYKYIKIDAPLTNDEDGEKEITSNIFYRSEYEKEIYGEKQATITFNFGLKDYINDGVTDVPFDIIVLEEDADDFESYINKELLSDTIKIYITRTHTGNNSTTGTLVTDDGTISGYTVELPREADSECKTICTDDETPYDCHCIVEGYYNFKINTKVYDPKNAKNHSLRIISSIPDGRSGVLLHGGRDDAKGWSMGCILPMPYEPEKNSKLYSKGRNNSKTQSVDFTKEILDWVRLREAEIKKINKDIKKVEKQIIITKIF